MQTNKKKVFQNILSIINLNALKSVAILPILYSKSNTPENFLMVLILSCACDFEGTRRNTHIYHKSAPHNSKSVHIHGSDS